MGKCKYEMSYKQIYENEKVDFCVLCSRWKLDTNEKLKLEVFNILKDDCHEKPTCLK